jgi:hypothetical protein
MCKCANGKPFFLNVLLLICPYFQLNKELSVKVCDPPSLRLRRTRATEDEERHTAVNIIFSFANLQIC